MGENTSISLEYTLTLHAVDFVKELKEVLLTSAHIQLVQRNIIYVSCFEQHVIEANNRMAIPLTERELNLVMIPLTAYLHPFCNNTQPNRSICLTIGAVLNQLINRRIFTTEFFQ